MRWGHLNLTTCIGAGRGAGRALGGRWVGAGRLVGGRVVLYSRHLHLVGLRCCTDHAPVLCDSIALSSSLWK